MVLETTLGLSLWLGAPAAAVALGKVLAVAKAVGVSVDEAIASFKAKTGMSPTAPYGVVSVNGNLALLEYKECLELVRGVRAINARAELGEMAGHFEGCFVSSDRTAELLQKGMKQAQDPVLRVFIPDDISKVFQCNTKTG